MNKIIRQHYPAAKLPNDLREGIDPRGSVTVTIVTEEAPPRRVMTLEEIFAARRPPYRTAADIDAEIRRSRGEWEN
jgi:hypothetical protein